MFYFVKEISLKACYDGQSASVYKHWIKHWWGCLRPAFESLFHNVNVFTFERKTLMIMYSLSFPLVYYYCYRGDIPVVTVW